MISTHTPHARCDEKNHRAIHRLYEFLLTHLMRGVTRRISTMPIGTRFLLTHLMRGVTSGKIVLRSNAKISTHTPHARCDKIRSNLK